MLNDVEKQPSDLAQSAVPVSRLSTGRAAVRILFFFVLLVGCLFGTDIAVNAGLRRIKTSSFGVSNRIMTGQVNADIVISGSSRALTHYDPRIIQARTGKTAFNIGRNGSQTDMQLAFLKAYLRHNRRPKVVVHNLDMFSFVTSKEVYDPAQYFPYLKDPDLYGALVKIHPGAWRWRMLPLYAYVVEDMRFHWMLGLRGLTGWNPPEDHYLGFTPRYTRWTGEFEKYRETHSEGVRFEIEAEAVLQLTELVEVCHRQQIPVILVYSPVYQEMTAMERNRAEVFGQFRSIADRYGATVWDFSDSPICREKDNFYNSQHLNAGGAAVFSEAFGEKLTVWFKERR